MKPAIRKRLFPILLGLLLSGCSAPDRPTISLYRALQAGDIDQLERHIYWGTDINVVDANGNMPLHVACNRGRPVIAELLLDNGAKIDALNRAGETPIYVSLMAGRTQVAELLVQHSAELDADRLLQATARNGVADRDVIEFLVRHGGDINNRDEEENTPLHHAISGGHRVVAKFLIARGADVNAVNKNGETVLQIAESVGNTDLINLLTRNGAISR